MAHNRLRPDSPVSATNSYTLSDANYTPPSRIIDDYPALAAYNRTLHGLNQFERARRRAENRVANVARLKARKQG